MRQFFLKRAAAALSLMLLPLTAVCGKTGSTRVDWIPQLRYTVLSHGGQTLRIPSAGLMLYSSNVTAVMRYQAVAVDTALRYGYPDLYHCLEAIAVCRQGRNRLLAVFKSESNTPLTGGWRSFKAALVYGYAVSSSPRFSLILGGGLAAGDLGVETGDGKIWPVLPVPFIRIFYNGTLLHGRFEFLTSPGISFDLFPGRRIRLGLEARLDEARDLRDLQFEAKLNFRFFLPGSVPGDIAGIAAGFRNGNYGEFSVNGRKNETVEFQYQSVFVALDISLIQLELGYAFNGREVYNGTARYSTGDGVYFQASALYRF